MPRLIHDQNLDELVLSAGTDGQVTVPETFRLIRMGLNRTTKGDYLVTPDALKTVIDNFKAKGRDLVFDYEHQTLTDKEAPASGWIKDLMAATDGLYAKVEWTPRGREYIANKEYRYFSPVVYPHKKTRVMMALGPCALTNDPATTAAEPLVNKDTNQEIEMDELKGLLIEALGLDAGISDEDLVAAVKGFKDAASTAQAEVALKAEVANSAIEALALKADAKGADVRGAVMALKNPAGHVPAEEMLALKEEVSRLKADAADRDADELVGLALRDGKITPAQKDWAKAYALKDREGFGAFVTAAPKVVETGMSASGGASRVAGASKLTEEERLVCKQMGLDEAEFLKHNAQA